MSRRQRPRAPPRWGPARRPRGRSRGDRTAPCPRSTPARHLQLQATKPLVRLLNTESRRGSRIIRASKWRFHSPVRASVWASPAATATTLGGICGWRREWEGEERGMEQTSGRGVVGMAKFRRVVVEGVGGVSGVRWRWCRRRPRRTTVDGVSQGPAAVVGHHNTNIYLVLSFVRPNNKRPNIAAVVSSKKKYSPIGRSGSGLLGRGHPTRPNKKNVETSWVMILIHDPA